MCGIVGVAGKIYHKERKAFNTLLILDSIRGMDSTGVAAVPDKGEVVVAKQLGNPFNLIDHRSYDYAINQSNRVLIGHNRYATQGAVSRKNAHPFDYDTVVGVHNGTLIGKYRLLDANQFSVDSDNLYHHIDVNGIDDALEVLEGAWCLVWWDKVMENLVFLRNEERPMYITKSANGESMFWASEKWMLEVALSRNEIKHDKIVSLEVDKIYSYHIGSDKVISKPKVRVGKSKYVKPSNVIPWNHGSSYSIPPTNNRPPVQTKSTVTTPPKTNRPTFKRRFRPLNDFYAGSKNVMLEVLAKHKDSFGAEYFVCYDPSNRTASIRLYCKPSDKESVYIGRDVIGDIDENVYQISDEEFYKVVYSSHRLSRIKQEDERGSDGVLYPDSKGRFILREEWVDKHGQCGWCNGDVLPELEAATARYTSEGDIICKECLSHDDVTQYVNLQ